MIDREQLIIIIVMKTLYFVVWNDCSILSYQDTCQLLSLLHTSNMLINNEYGSYTLRYIMLKYLWTILKHISDGLLTWA